MPHLRFPIAPLTAYGLALALVLGAMVGLTAQPLAQEQFFTQSGGRGLQNAKTNARLSKAENDIGVVQEDLKTIKPHARAELGNCDGEGEKLRFDGSNWICEKETDPTVQAFAKQPLPSCSGGKTLGIVAGNLGCSTTSFVTSESDPTVQGFAKQPLPTCNSDQLLAVQNGALSCMTDQRGLSSETDPKVHDFARKDAVAAVPTCSPSELLTMTGGRLVCKIDQIGITEEADPKVQDFARNDIGEAALTSCGAGQVLRSTVGTSGKIIIACDSAASQLSEALTLGDLSDVDTAGQTSGTTLTYSNGQWRAIAGLGSADNPLFLSQLGDVTISAPASDDVVRWNGSRWVNSVDKISTMTDTNWCRVDGTRVVCDRPPPLTCAASEVLSWNGASSTWVCTDAATGIGQALSLNTLNDVTITTPAIGQALRYDGSGWANSTIERILAGDTQIVATDTGTDGLLSFATDGATRMAITNEGRVGIGVMPASPYLLDVGGAIRASGGISTTDFVAGNGVFSGNLTIGGNLNVSGAQSLDGVLFANGGIQAPGSVTAGGISATNVSVTQALTANTIGAQDVSISRNLTVAGNLDVLGDQSIGGVLFANGGIALSGDIQAGRISATNISGSVADIVTLRGDSLAYTNGNIGTATITQLNGANISATTADLTTLRTAGLLTAQDVSISRNVTIAGNLDVLGNQSIAGVLFANGGIQLGGDIEAGRVSTTYLSSTLADIISLRTTTISNSGNVTINGSLTAGSAGFGPLAASTLTVTGGTQLAAVSATDISATGNISANTFIGSGAGLTNLPATGITAAGVVGSVQFKGPLNEISGTNTLTVTSAANRADLKVSGTVQLSGDTTENCTGTATYGQIRFVDAGAGKLAMQICRP